MEISVPKTKVMVVSRVPLSVAAFSCNGNLVEQVSTFKYLGLHFHESGALVHLVNPVKSKADGSWAAVQRRHSLLQCGNTVNLQLHLLQAVLVPVLQYGCQICTARVLLLLIMLTLICSACMITILKQFVICCHPPL